MEKLHPCVYLIFKKEQMTIKEQYKVTNFHLVRRSLQEQNYQVTCNHHIFPSHTVRIPNFSILIFQFVFSVPICDKQQVHKFLLC